MQKEQHPMLNRKCIIRTYSAGVHLGKVVAVNGTELHLQEAVRVWYWKGFGISLSSVAQKGIKEGSRLVKTGEVFLTEVIEIIPVTPEAEKTYANFIEE